ncbi:hypothetical protein [Acidisoma sp. C75]
MRSFGLLLLVACAAGAGTVVAAAETPQLAQAMAALQKARGYLSETRNNKGGHPQAAIALIDRAEAEIRAVGP